MASPRPGRRQGRAPCPWQPVGFRPRLPAVRIEVNGEARDVDTGTTVAALLRELGVDDGPVAVERNEAIVPRAEHATTSLAEGDRVEVVRFVGGG